MEINGVRETWSCVCSFHGDKVRLEIHLHGARVAQTYGGGCSGERDSLGSRLDLRGMA